MPPFSREAVRLAAVIALAALSACAIYLVASGLIGKTKRQAAEARVAQVIATAQAKAASDAIALQDQARTKAQVSEALSRETADVISHAPGADQRLDARLNRAALERLCQRPSLGASAQCLQFVDRPDASR